MAIDSIPISQDETKITATTSGAAQEVASIPDGQQYNVRLTATNNSGTDGQNIYVTHDGGTTFKYKSVDDGESIIIQDIVLTASGADIDFDAYAQSADFFIEALIFDINTI